ncbi:putative transmembrane protein [Toxoplasma gondii MAS]|uniref:Putative transmembrane protein n=1 Tax=Toxoplasma gondii MAS TaxID=943118 RepID=A0A086QCJ1_TOXGO|nr:putative transmembrane protein [Toxoplasma gondii MAS]
MKDTGSVLGEASLVCAASTPLVLGELFCFTLVGVTLMLLSMSYIDRFESLLAIPPVRNRWWLASCALLTVVIALTVTTRVTLHRRYLDSAACQESRKAEFSSSAVFSGSSRPFQSEGALGAEGVRMAAPEQRAGNDRPEAAGRADVHARPQETRKFTNYAALIWPHWSLCLLAGLLWIFVVIVDELVKRVERQTHEHHQKYLKVLFATRLGMWSPK